MERENFGSRTAAVLAMAGSAIGLGNIWRFPYMVGENGGAAFVIVYIVFSMLLSLPILLSETILGRHSRSNTFGALSMVSSNSPLWRNLGIITIIAPIIILSYYSVVGGWSVGYLAKAVTGEFSGTHAEVGAEQFNSFISSPYASVTAHTIFLAIVALVVLGGVKKGIEIFSKITIPMLFVLIVVIIAYSVSLPGASEGISYLVKPDFSKLTAKGVAAAMGQSFYSISLGVGTMLTYASYMRRKDNLLTSALGTTVSDIMFALLAGFAVIPAVFAAGLKPEAGAGLVFETLPFVFNKMGAESPWLSTLVAVIFFISILVAAVTSAISMMEVGVAYLCEEKNMPRKKAVALIFGFTWAVGVVCALSFGPLAGVSIFGNNIFEALDKLSSNVLMAFGSLVFVLAAGWKMSKEDFKDELSSGGMHGFNAKCYPVIRFFVKYIAPAGVIAIFISNLVI